MFVVNAARISELALAQRLPVFSGSRPLTEAGTLASYGPDQPAIAQRSAAYVQRILKGAKPGDLSVEQATKFELVINIKTAKALGLTIPQPLLLRADEANSSISRTKKRTWGMPALEAQRYQTGPMRDSSARAPRFPYRW